MWARCLVSLVVLAAGLVVGQDRSQIALDPELFSERFREEFIEMNDIFAEFGFELEVIEGERPSLAVIIGKYGEPDRLDQVEVITGFGDAETKETLTFSYFGDFGFGLRPDDPEQLVRVVKRREG